MTRALALPLLLPLSLSLAACKALPEIPLGVCGNHLLDPGEECDSGDDPNCAPPNTPDACHLRCGTTGGGDCPPGETCADTGFCRPRAGVCGNRVVENNEDCDGDEAGCGTPDAGTRACRLLCARDADAGAACPTGGSCGADGVCRFATGTYTLGPVVGNVQQFFGVLDVDGDGVPDLVGRDVGRATFYKNDGAGAFSEWATGAMHPRLNIQPPPGVTAVPPPLAHQPLYAAETDQGVELFTLESPKKLVPVAAPSALLQPQRTGERLLGAVRRVAGAAAELLYYDSTSKLLVTYFVPTDYNQGATLRQASTFDVSLCGVTPGTVDGTVDTPVTGTSTIALKLDSQKFCVVTPTAGVWTGAALTVPGVGALVDGKPFFGDVDGDGHRDVALNWLDLTGAFPNGALAVYRWRPTGYAAAVLVPMDALFSGYPVAMGDFDADGRDDLVINGEVALNHTAASAPDGGFNADGGFEFQPQNPAVSTFGDIDLNVAGDVNRDTFADLVLAQLSSPDLLICLGDGSGVRFTCTLQTTDLAGVTSLALADVNGDATLDVLAVGGPPPVPALPAEPGLAVAVGRPFMTPDPATLSLPVYRDQIAGAAVLPSPSAIASDVLAAIRTLDGRQGIAVAHGDPQGALSFAFPFRPIYDLRMADVDGDAKLDLAVLTPTRLNVLYGNGQGGFAGGLRAYAGQFPDEASPFYELMFANLAGDPLTMIGFDYSGLLVTHLQTTLVAGSEYLTNEQLFYPFIWNGDLDGDGANELFLWDLNGDTCKLVVGRFPANAAATFTVSDPIVKCSYVAGLVDVPPLDGRLDAIFAQRGGDGHDRLVVAALGANDKFDVMGALPSPAIFAAGSSAELTAFDPSWGWIDAADFNGDGVRDFLLATPFGTRVATADVRLK
jgi:hypothetical protein